MLNKLNMFVVIATWPRESRGSVTLTGSDLSELWGFCRFKGEIDFPKLDSARTLSQTVGYAIAQTSEGLGPRATYITQPR